MKLLRQIKFKINLGYGRAFIRTFRGVIRKKRSDIRSLNNDIRI